MSLSVPTAASAKTLVDLCVCTYRRPYLEETLRSLAMLDMPAGVAARIVVADNDITDSARQLVQYRGNCFELMGFDVMVDRRLGTWMIEVNPDPDMSASKGFILAEQVKGRMLR